MAWKWVVLPSSSAAYRFSQNLDYKGRQIAPPGAPDEVPGRPVWRNFLEHMMFKGNGHRGTNRFSRTVVRRNCGRDNAYKKLRFARYYQTVQERLEM